MLSLSCKVAIKSVILLGTQFPTGHKTGIREIASMINENEHTVGKILQTLVRTGIINSVKGPNGGFYITEEQTEQPVINIVEAIDGLGIFNQCGLGLTKCSEDKPCPLHFRFKVIRDEFEKLLVDNKIRDLYGSVHKGLAYLT